MTSLPSPVTTVSPGRIGVCKVAGCPLTVTVPVMRYIDWSGGNFDGLLPNICAPACTGATAAITAAVRASMSRRRRGSSTLSKRYMDAPLKAHEINDGELVHLVARRPAPCVGGDRARRHFRR